MMSPKPLSDVDPRICLLVPIRPGASVVLFIFCCLASSVYHISDFAETVVRGRPLSNTQVNTSVINGAITALYFILWGKSLKSIGPQRTILAEYSGAVLGVLSGRVVWAAWDICKKALRRVIARRVSLKNQFKRRLHAITIASATCFLFPVAMWDIIIGSTTNRDMNMPFSLWAYSSFILFGIVLTFYVDSIAEERLHMVFSSPRHLMVAGDA
ncbi:unnamed protein product [Rhodiola kirilowii]